MRYTLSMIIVGITGSIGHGKTTFANYLGQSAPSHIHFESSDIIIEIANALRTRSIPIEPHVQYSDADRNILLAAWLKDLPGYLLTHTRVKVSYDSLKVTAADFAAKADHYERLFSYFTYLVADIIPQQQIITADNKAQFRPLLQWLGGYLAKNVSGTLWFDEIVCRALEAPADIVTAGGVRFPADTISLRKYPRSVILAVHRPHIGVSDANDVTERERSMVVYDSLIINDGNLEDLAACSRKVYHDLVANHLQTEYRAAGDIKPV
ncbi:MAG: hypothetical protein JWM81_882 [Candidatus Saccharibacteria bacterium]|nr:hypothetical protein [Candidatus Saccharibacteria bacterium]